MGQKKTINLAIPAELADRFGQICGQYGHGKQKGMVLGAAILMFLEAQPRLQGEYVKRLAVADIESGVERLQARAVGTMAGLKRAAKRAARDSVRGLGGLPKPPVGGPG